MAGIFFTRTKMECKICGERFDEGSESLNLCAHKEGFVHLDCCRNNCSLHGEPCEHSISLYERL